MGRYWGLLTIFLMLLSFVFGQHWLDVLVILNRSFAALREFSAQDVWHLRETWAQSHPFESSLISLIPAYIVFILSRFIRALQIRLVSRIGAKSVLDMIFYKQSTIHIVISSITEASFRTIGRTSKTIVTPVNVTLVPFGDSESMTMISEYFRKKYGGKKSVRIWPSNSVDIPKTDNFIAIGGPYVNTITKRYVEDIGIKGFVVDQNSVIHIGNKTYEARMDEKNHVFVDFGFAACLHMPGTENQRVLLLFGIYSQGTRAATEAAVGMTGRSPKRTAFRKLVARNKDAIAVLKSTGTGSSEFQSQIEEVSSVELS